MPSRALDMVAGPGRRAPPGWARAVAGWLAVSASLACWPQAARAEVCDSQGRLSPAALEVLNIMAEGVAEAPAAGFDLVGGQRFAERHLMRPRHAQRTDAQAAAHCHAILAGRSTAQRARLAAAFVALGWLDAVPPPAEPVDYILINDSTVPSMRARVMAVAEAVEQRTLKLAPATQVVFLDGERPLFAEENAAVLRDPAPFPMAAGWAPPVPLPDDERAAAEMVWQQLRLPAALRARTPRFVHGAARAGAPRAETQDCVALWLAGAPPPEGLALVVSDQPFVEYQRRVTEVILARHGARRLHVAAMGAAPRRLEGIDETVRLGVLLDNLANTLFRARQSQELRRAVP